MCRWLCMMITELKYQHEMEISNWESLMQASQELLRQHVNKHKEQVRLQSFFVV